METEDLQNLDEGAVARDESAAVLDDAALKAALDAERRGSSVSLDAKHLAKTAGSVAASAVLATSLTAALTEPPRADLITLPEPTPIVQTYNPYADDIEPAEEDEDDEASSRWRKILKFLRLLAISLIFIGTLALGVLKGCAGCTAGLLLPPDDPPQEEQAQQ